MAVCVTLDSSAVRAGEYRTQYHAEAIAFARTEQQRIDYKPNASPIWDDATLQAEVDIVNERGVERIIWDKKQIKKLPSKCFASLAHVTTFMVIENAISSLPPAISQVRRCRNRMLGHSTCCR